MSRTTTSLHRPPRRPGRLLSLIAMAVALLATVASTAEDEARRVDEGSEADQGAEGAGGDPAQPEEFAVGDLVELGDWQVRVHGVTDPVQSTDEFLTPAPGNRWVAVDVEVTNTGDQPETVSSIMCFEVLDDQNRSHTQTVTGLSGSVPPDGEVAAGGSRRGTLEYEVPGDAGGLRLSFACDLLSQGSATIALGG